MTEHETCMPEHDPRLGTKPESVLALTLVEDEIVASCAGCGEHTPLVVDDTEVRAYLEARAHT